VAYRPRRRATPARCHRRGRVGRAPLNLRARRASAQSPSYRRSTPVRAAQRPG
jgi:hypothetical protein